MSCDCARKRPAITFLCPEEEHLIVHMYVFGAVRTRYSGGWGAPSVENWGCWLELLRSKPCCCLQMSTLLSRVTAIRPSASRVLSLIPASSVGPSKPGAHAAPCKWRGGSSGVAPPATTPDDDARSPALQGHSALARRRTCMTVLDTALPSRKSFSE
eukprot:3933956-Rhodomonas_salina.1